jgi:hypothetical protein
VHDDGSPKPRKVRMMQMPDGFGYMHSHYRCSWHLDYEDYWEEQKENGA